MLHNCKYCEFETAYRPHVRKHENNKHGLETLPPINMHLINNIDRGNKLFNKQKNALSQESFWSQK
jgi:hypothetical protein